MRSRYRVLAPALISMLLLSVLLVACSKSSSDYDATETAAVETQASEPCVASASWVSNPNPPSEIGNGVPVGQETNCQFYQFGWQWFLQLASPLEDSGERGFEALNVFQPGQTSQCAQDAIATGVNAMAQSLSVRLAKDDDQDSEHVVPAELAQATGQALYDQDGNIVLYTIGYSPNECMANATDGYLPNTIETKLSWRVLEPDEPALDTYYQMTDVVVPEISSDPITIGLVGFHLVINTENHPEFVWLTWEHKANAPNCTDPQAAPANGWSFLSADCAQCLANPTSSCEDACSFNTGVSCGGSSDPCQVTGDPNEVCQKFAWGTDPGSSTGGNDNDTNRYNIETLNTQLVGAGGFVTSDPDMAIWQNYQMVGGLWTNGGVPSGGTDVQRGSLELANTTMETFFQQPQRNCFTCHNYTTDAPLDVSHIIDDLLPQSGSSE